AAGRGHRRHQLLGNPGLCQKSDGELFHLPHSVEQPQAPGHHRIHGLRSGAKRARRFRAPAQALFSSFTGMRSRLSGVLELGLALSAALLTVPAVPAAGISALSAEAATAIALGATAREAGPDSGIPAAAGSKSSCWSMARLKYGGGGDWYSGPTMLTNLARRLKADL